MVAACKSLSMFDLPGMRMLVFELLDPSPENALI